MRINSEITNKNLNFLNRKLYKKNLNLNSLQIEDKGFENHLNFSPELKVKLMNIESSNKNFTENFIILISQSKNQIEIPFQALNTLNASENQNTINFNKTQLNQNSNFNLSKNNKLNSILNNFANSDNKINFRTNLPNQLDNSHTLNGKELYAIN